ncbi:2OG-Fe(II) oxygenase [Pelagibius sp. Alg239-R121]|uniref:2OG-Fe(II) oxygenase n=1 Tax=Pelagibius sp. Alg239-R121 TaxID=2993448 RepID=UPI0024A7485E|nr:2OG-Fe(II) oxygenase [Pelagibius sp. Alg239-R121]
MTKLTDVPIPFDTALQLEAGDRIDPFSLPDQDGFTFQSLSDTVAGLPMLLVFECSRGEADPDFERDLSDLRDQLDPGLTDDVVILAITRRTEGENGHLRDRLGLSIHFLSDLQGLLFRACGLEPAPSGCGVVALVLDQQARVCGIMGGRGGYIRQALDLLKATADEQEHDRLRAHAPVIVVKRVLTPEDCARLIQIWHQPVPVWTTDGLVCDGHEAEPGDFKVQGEEPYKVLQYVVRDPQIQRYLDAKIIRRIKPEVEKAFQTGFSKREEYRIAAYGPGDYLAPHRDNPTAKTRHRRFTVSVTLNAEEFEGGALQFREYGGQEYLVETGCAIIWSCSLLHEVRPVTAGRRFILGTHFFGD